MAESMTIAALMQVPERDHDIAWLKNALQAAINLELATLPPYLFAFWSIQNSADEVATWIREIALQEMMHMGMMCNLLAGIGDFPRVNIPSQVPVYPGELPGGVHPGLIVGLKAFSRDLAQLFMTIEYPEHGPIALVAVGETFPTIGAFYTAVQTAFMQLRPPLSPARQFAGFVGLTKLQTPGQVMDAIETIKQQGEGSTISPDQTGPGSALAHYYRFGEMYNGKRLIYDSAARKWVYAGAVVTLPAVWPVDPIPAGGYRQQNVPPAAWTLIAACDKDYTDMLNQITAAWRDGNAATLGQAVGTMFSLGGSAKQLMQIRKPSGPGNYGPCFRFVPGA